MDNPFYSGTVAVIGLGYIGLPTAVVLASRGVSVIGVDVNQLTVERVARGEIPFFEPDLATSLSGAVALGNISTSTEAPVADAYIIAVPTPITPHEEADLSHVWAAADAIAPQLPAGRRRRARVDLTARHHRGAQPAARRRPTRPHLPRTT